MSQYYDKSYVSPTTITVYQPMMIKYSFFLLFFFFQKVEHTQKLYYIFYKNILIVWQKEKNTSIFSEKLFVLQLLIKKKPVEI